MPGARACSQSRLVNGSTGDPVLFVEYPLPGHAVLFDAGENDRLSLDQLDELEAVFLTHHHLDHFVGLDRIFRANRDETKALHIFGPVHTIQRVYNHLTSYDPNEPDFKKCSVEVRELLPGKIRRAVLQRAEEFTEPVIQEQARKGNTPIYANEHFLVEACPTDHTVPGYAYALVEKPGWHPDAQKLARGPLRPGPWVAETLKLLRAGAAPDTTVQIAGGSFPLRALAEQCFAETGGGRITFITDTAWSDASRAGLTKLARKAQRLYCDSYYAPADVKRAEQYRHMTAAQAAELAQAARVEQLILIHFATRYTGRYGELIEAARAIFPRVSADLSLAR
jgi:ribonuclease Z